MGQRSSPHCLHEGTGPTENIAFSPGNLSASRLNWAAFGRQQRAARKKLSFLFLAHNISVLFLIPP